MEYLKYQRLHASSCWGSLSEHGKPIFSVLLCCVSLFSWNNDSGRAGSGGGSLYVQIRTGCAYCSSRTVHEVILCVLACGRETPDMVQKPRFMPNFSRPF